MRDMNLSDENTSRTDSLTGPSEVLGRELHTSKPGLCPLTASRNVRRLPVAIATSLVCVRTNVFSFPLLLFLLTVGYLSDGVGAAV